MLFLLINCSKLQKNGSVIQMKRIGLLSDTHGFFDERLFHHFKDCDELWHAGDIGNEGTLNTLSSFKPVKAVYGNIDGSGIRSKCSLHQRFFSEKVDVWMTHIGGYPNQYDVTIRDEIRNNPPDLFITGHSHILKVMYDKKLGLLHINPGAAGKYGFHKVRTAVRFIIEGEKIKELEIIELGQR